MSEDEGGCFEFVDEVTSDLTVEAHGPSLAAVFRALAEALLAASVENPERVEGSETREVQLADAELDLLLLRFLNELIYLRDAQHLLLRPRSVEIRQNGETQLRAELVGEPLDPARHVLAGDVKATTAHGLRVTATEGGFEAHVTFDV